MPTKLKTSLSVSIVCYNSPSEQLEALLESLLRSILRVRQFYNLSVTQIYLIDNSDHVSVNFENFEDQRCSFEEHQVRLRYLHGHGNIGYGGAHNLVLSNLKSCFHLVLNPDVVVDEDALLESFKILSGDSEIAMLSPNAINFSGDKQHLCKRYPSVFIFLIRGFFPRNLKKLFTWKLAKYEMHDLSETKLSENVPVISGCFMFVRTKFLAEIKGFDKRYFLYFEDFDLSLRISKLGKLVFAPRVRITHGGGNASKKGFWHLYNFVRSGFRFFKTHGWNFF